MYVFDNKVTIRIFLIVSDIWPVTFFLFKVETFYSVEIAICRLFQNIIASNGKIIHYNLSTFYFMDLISLSLKLEILQSLYSEKS
jgi:hypothetical protein